MEKVTFIEKFNTIYYTSLDILMKISVMFAGLIPPYFAISQLIRVTNLAEVVGDTAAWVIGFFFAFMLEIIGVAITKLFVDTLLQNFKQVPQWLAMSAGAIYLVDMMLLAVGSHVLHGDWIYINIPLLVVMPPLGYLSLGVQARKDEESKKLSEDTRFQQSLELLRINQEADRKNRKLELDYQVKMSKKMSSDSVQETVQKSVQRDTITVGTSDLDKKEAILGQIALDNNVSLRKIEKATGIPKSSVAALLSQYVEMGVLKRTERGYITNGYHND